MTQTSDDEQLYPPDISIPDVLSKKQRQILKKKNAALKEAKAKTANAAKANASPNANGTGEDDEESIGNASSAASVSTSTSKPRKGTPNKPDQGSQGRKNKGKVTKPVRRVLEGPGKPAHLSSLHEWKSNGILGDIHSSLSKSDRAELNAIVRLILEIVGVLSVNSFKGKNLIERQLAAAHIHKFQTLEDFHPKVLSYDLNMMEGVFVNAMSMIGKFLRIDTKERVLVNLGISRMNLKAETVR